MRGGWFCSHDRPRGRNRHLKALPMTEGILVVILVDHDDRILLVTVVLPPKQRLNRIHSWLGGATSGWFPAHYLEKLLFLLLLLLKWHQDLNKVFLSAFLYHDNFFCWGLLVLLWLLLFMSFWGVSSATLIHLNCHIVADDRPAVRRSSTNFDGSSLSDAWWNQGISVEFFSYPRYCQTWV